MTVLTPHSPTCSRYNFNGSGSGTERCEVTLWTSISRRSEQQSARGEEGGSLKIQRKTLKFIERSLLLAGAILVAVYLAALLHQKISSHLALRQFDKAKSEAKQKDGTTSIQSKGEDKIDFSRWAEKRIDAYKESLLSKTDPPLAVLEIARLGIRVPVFEGTDNLTLNRGVGRIVGTAMLGTPGNIGIAGHRDGFFRGLKDIAVGDEVDLDSTNEKAKYFVDQIEIVSPDNIGVLRQRSAPSLTLVTCYPFYFVGDAPKRYIVHASLASARSSEPTQSHRTYNDQSNKKNTK